LASPNDWLSISTGKFNGFIGNGTSLGVQPLTLPFVQGAAGSAQQIAIIRKAPLGESATSSTGSSREFNKANIRVLLASTQADLVPDRLALVGDADNINLDAGCAGGRTDNVTGVGVSPWAMAQLPANQVGTVFRQDLAPQGGLQPRINPKNDAVILSAVNEKTGKRDLWKMSDKGGLPENLTNTPDVDEFDAAWNKDGTKIAFASDRAVDEKGRNNLDIWVMDVSHPQQPLQITSNASQDDGPQWDASGNAIYFRSNRSGEWGIWKISVK